MHGAGPSVSHRLPGRSRGHGAGRSTAEPGGVSTGWPRVPGRIPGRGRGTDFGTDGASAARPTRSPAGGDFRFCRDWEVAAGTTGCRQVAPQLDPIGTQTALGPPSGRDRWICKLLETKRKNGATDRDRTDDLLITNLCSRILFSRLKHSKVPVSGGLLPYALPCCILNPAEFCLQIAYNFLGATVGVTGGDHAEAHEAHR